jgi:hypothetical protein
MSVSILEVIEAGGYDLTTYEDCKWLLSKQKEFTKLIEKAEQLVDEQDEKESEESELEYQKRFGDE